MYFSNNFACSLPIRDFDRPRTSTIARHRLFYDYWPAESVYNDQRLQHLDEV
jgi:hypothetical protein